METFRNSTKKLSSEGASSFVGRSTEEGSPSAILAGIVIHACRRFGNQIKPLAFKRMDPVVAIALQCDLIGSDTEIRARMKTAGLTSGEIERLWAVSDKSAKDARNARLDQNKKLKEPDANICVFSSAQTDLIGFLKED